jgi:hypothetical protein
MTRAVELVTPRLRKRQWQEVDRLPSGENVALIGPPEPYPEVIPNAPYPGAFWVSGYWAYRPLGTFWVPGRYWSAAPRSPWVR